MSGGKSRRSSSRSMSPAATSAIKQIEDFITNNCIAIFSKSWCPWCTKAKDAFIERGFKYASLELDLVDNGAALQKALKQLSGQKTVPNIYINNRHIGGYSNLLPYIEGGVLDDLCNGLSLDYDYDLVVVGGGSGGIAAAREASRMGLKVALCDFVEPTPLGTKWGLGGTCVNVGCIPKKLMHRAAVLREDMSDAMSFGWDVQLGSQSVEVRHNWEGMVDKIQNHIKSLNFGYRKTLMENDVKYYNAFASFVDKHTLALKSNDTADMRITARNFLIATGCRPKYPDIKNAKELCITSDDLFSMRNAPRKTLVIGGSYVALECAGFITGLGYETTVMVRSILLRGFDQQMADLIENHMESCGIKFIKNCVPYSFEKDSKRGKIIVKGQMNDNKVHPVGIFDTVLIAIGREACTEKLGLEGIGVKINTTSRKIITDSHERTATSHIFALGDVADGRIELTPVAIQAGKLLARRLAGVSLDLMDYKNVATTVFTPCEYGCVGFSEEDARKQFDDKIEVYHQEFTPLEHVLQEGNHPKCYAKLVVIKEDQDERVIGAHIFSPNAGEVIQGFALGIKMGAKKKNFDELVGIHPTIAEIFTTLDISKSSGLTAASAGC